MVLELPDASVSKPKTKADELFAAHDPTKPKKKAAPKAGRKRRRGAGDAEDNDDNETTSTPAGENNDTNSSSKAPLVQELQDLNLAAAAAQENSSKGLQIMDLESDEPMVMYTGQIYSCKWATSLGSDLLFMRRHEEPGDDYQPLHSFEEVDLLSIATAKLIARQATVERKPFTAPPIDQAANPDTNVAIQNEDIIRQAKFLSRIADIKAKRGEFAGNLKTSADSVLLHPEMYTPDGKKKSGGGRGRGAPTPRRRPTAAKNRPSPSDEPTIASTRSRRASTQSATAASAAGHVQLDDDEEMIDV